MQKQLKVCVLNNNIVSQIYVFTGNHKDVGQNMIEILQIGHFINLKAYLTKYLNQIKKNLSG